MPPQRLQYQNVSLRQVSDSSDDKAFISSLFQVPDIKLHFTLRDDHAANIYSFVEYLSTANQRGTGFNCIIENNSLTPVGLLTAEPYRDNMNGELAWNIGFAIKPSFRNKGYAKMALQALQDFLSNYTINAMVLDISTENQYARAVAGSCGFEQRKSSTGGLVGYFDQEHPELGMRTQWIKEVHEADPRADAFRKAVDAYRGKQYREAIYHYYEAAEEPYRAGSPFTDAQIFSNLGMAYSSIREYKKAYMYLTKAWDLGCQNASVSKELEWLRSNAADLI